jgi:hypothetical protein
VPTAHDHPAVQRVLAAAQRMGIALVVVAFEVSTLTAV